MEQLAIDALNNKLEQVARDACSSFGEMEFIDSCGPEHFETYGMVCHWRDVVEAFREWLVGKRVLGFRELPSVRFLDDNGLVRCRCRVVLDQ